MPIEVIVDNRLRMRVGPMSSRLPEHVAKELREEFTYTNPAHQKLVAMGRWPGKEPKQHMTWTGDEGDDEFTLPRGGMQRLRDKFDEHNLSYRVDDRRTRGNPGVTGSFIDPWQLGMDLFPKHKLVAWEHQEEMVEAARQYGQILMRAPTGCITGDAMIGINRGGKGQQVRLDHLVKMHNGGKTSNRVWSKDIQTRVRARMEDGTVRLVDLVDAYESGVKSVYEVTFESCHKVTTTKDHRFMTVDGWKSLTKLRMGDSVYVEMERRPVHTGTADKKWYKLRAARYHEYVGRKGVKSGKGGYTVPLHRLVADARLNNMSVERFIELCNESKTAVTGLRFIDPNEWAVHHVDLNPRNNAPENLEVMTHAEHRQVHADLATRNIAVRTVPSEVVGIRYVGEVETYDLAMEAPHNFIANGVTVHNSGKTSALLKLIAELQVPALVIMWETGLLKQWQRRIEVELGILIKDQGVIQGSKFKLAPITLAMQQTFIKWDEAKWARLDGVFGFVACDEVQRYAARTFTGIVDRFDSFYRVGVSADERRKDRKTYLIYDMFGKPRVDIKKKTLIEKRIIHEVECYVMPTQFMAPWYVDKREAKELADSDFNVLLTEMQDDDDRNALAVHLLQECVRAGLPSLAFTRWVEHSQKIAHALTMKGIATGLAIGGPEWSDTFDETIEQLSDGRLQVGCGTFGKLGVGHDIPAVAAGVAITPVHTNKGFLGQLKGRICRTTAGKENARIIVMWDRHVFGEPALVNLRRWNEICRVWCEWDNCWKDIDQYMRENRYAGQSTSTSAASTEGIFKSAHT